LAGSAIQSPFDLKRSFDFGQPNFDLLTLSLPSKMAKKEKTGTAEVKKANGAANGITNEKKAGEKAVIPYGVIKLTAKGKESDKLMDQHQ
jgi:hypothetical protein